jgi:putative copper export protein
MAISWIVFGCIFGGAVLGLLLRNLLPEHHLDDATQRVVNLGMALIATLSALVLGLLIASAKSSYDAQKEEVTQMSANAVLLDRILAHYGPEANGTRVVLRRVVVSLDRSWSKNFARSELDSPEQRALVESFLEKIQELAPHNDFQRSFQSQALQTALSVGQTRSLLLQQGGSSVPIPFLVVMVFWLALIFTSFGLFAPTNATAVATLMLCALSVSGAIYLVLELNTPFSGLMAISDTPLRNALARIGQ